MIEDESPALRARFCRIGAKLQGSFCHGFRTIACAPLDKLQPHEAFFADVKSDGGAAGIVIQFMDGFLADELSGETLARRVDLDLSLAIECFAGLQQ